MPFKHYWQHYRAEHAHSAAHGIAIDPAALVGMLVCAVLLFGWAGLQHLSRCRTCGGWPVRCRCSERSHSA